MSKGHIPAAFSVSNKILSEEELTFLENTLIECNFYWENDTDLSKHALEERLLMASKVLEKLGNL